jgi:TRAP-type uncharacterized transport system substrate-binding protein
MGKTGRSFISNGKPDYFRGDLLSAWFRLLSCAFNRMGPCVFPFRFSPLNQSAWFSGTSGKGSSWLRRVRALGFFLSLVMILFGRGLPEGGMAAKEAWAAEEKETAREFFRIATGGTSGNDYPVGSIIASAISSPPDSPPCTLSGPCGVPGLLAVAQATAGSMENLRLLAARQVEAAIVQADLAFWAQAASGPFRSAVPFTGLRALGALYPKAVQVVVRADSDLQSLSDLNGKIVSIGEEGSGTLAGARLLLSMQGLVEQVALVAGAPAMGVSGTGVPGAGAPVAGLRFFIPRYFKPGGAAERLAKREIDALIEIGAPPLPTITSLAERLPIRFLGIEPVLQERLKDKDPFLIPYTLSNALYPGTASAETLGVMALLVVRDDLDEALVFDLLQALWQPRNREILDSNELTRFLGRGRGAIERLIERVPIPLHAGCERFVREVLYGLPPKSAAVPSASSAIPGAEEAKAEETPATRSGSNPGSSQDPLP